MWTLKILTLLVFLENIFGFQLDLRVVNGTRADPGEFPFMVSIRPKQGGSHACGGSIVSPMWVLTAGHCAAGLKPDSLNIQYGVSKLSKYGPNIVNVTEIVVYWGYYLPAVLHDIAMLRVQEPFVFSQSVQAIRLPRMYELTPEGSTATLIGWGLNASGGNIQSDLQKVDLKVYSREECNKLHVLQIHPTNICAGVEGGGKGQCNGDSGGPLIVNGRQVAISSWSIKPCTVAPYPGVYTEVSNYIDWIAYVMEDDAEDNDDEDFLGFL